MSDNKNMDRLDELFREQFSGAEQTPPPGVWEGISGGIGAGASGSMAILGKAVIGKWVAAIATVGVVSYGAWKLSSGNETISKESEALVEQENIQLIEKPHHLVINLPS